MMSQLDASFSVAPKHTPASGDSVVLNESVSAINEQEH